MDLTPGGGREVTFTILLVCTANICRSPGAERLLALELSRRELVESLDIKIGSAGVHGFDGAPMDRHAAAALEARGGTAADFRSRPLTESMLERANLVLTATKAHRGEVVARSPRALRRTFTMKEFACLLADAGSPSAATDLVAEAYRRRGGSAVPYPDVADPYGGTDVQHAAAMEEIHDAMAAIAVALAGCAFC